MSRSVTLVVAYIMTVTGRGWVESLAAVRAARPCAGPNLGFLRQLEEFEKTELREVSCRLLEAQPTAVSKVSDCTGTKPGSGPGSSTGYTSRLLWIFMNY